MCSHNGVRLEGQGYFGRDGAETGNIYLTKITAHAKKLVLRFWFTQRGGLAIINQGVGELVVY